MTAIKSFVAAILLTLPAPIPQVPEAVDPTSSVDVTLSRYAFSPERIEVRQGNSVQLNLTSVDVKHGVEIYALGLKAEVPAGQTTSVTLTPKVAGTFEITCSKYCGIGHRRMKAVLVVKPADDRDDRSIAPFTDSQSANGAAPPPPAGQPAVSATDDGEPASLVAEPDFNVINLPSTLGLPVRGSSFQLTHRFNGNLRQGSFADNAGNLFGLDQGAVVGFEYRFGVVRHLQAVAYRTAIDQTFQFHAKYDALRQRRRMPVAVSGLLSVEGTDNFQERYVPAIGAVASRRVSDRLVAYITPLWVHNTGAAVNVDRDTVVVGVGGRARISANVYVVAEFAPRASGYRPGQAAFGFGIEKRAGGHMFQLNFNNGQGTTLGQLARGGSAESLYLGFNLARKFF